MKRTLITAGLLLMVAAAAVAQERVGVATTVVGPVTVTRVATAPAPLKFKDDVLLNDRIVTGDEGFARVLLGGKAIVTARERSVIVITEHPGTSTIDLVSGRISVAVDKAKMRTGDVVEIKTPNAVSGVRGTIVVAEAAGDLSRITVLRGLVEVYRRDPVSGNAVGPGTMVGLRETLTVRSNVVPVRPQTISPESARKLSGDFAAPVRPVSPTAGLVHDEVTRANELMGARATAPGRLDTPGAPGPRATAGDKGAPGPEAAPLPRGTGPVTVGPLPAVNGLPPIVALPGSERGVPQPTLPPPPQTPGVPILRSTPPIK